MSTETTTDVSPTRYFWLWSTALLAAVGVLLLAHYLGGGMGVAMLVAAGALALVGRAVHVIVTSAFSDAHRIFRTRHLLTCAALLSVIGAGEAVVVLARGPFGKLFAHGSITGKDVVDVATLVAAVVCLVGAGAALTGAWERMHVERNWHHALHPHSRRGT
jgi:hypothetical protein